VSALRALSAGCVELAEEDSPRTGVESRGAGCRRRAYALNLVKAERKVANCDDSIESVIG
jgi:hypothetical protein